MKRMDAARGGFPKLGPMAARTDVALRGTDASAQLIRSRRR